MADSFELLEVSTPSGARVLRATGRLDAKNAQVLAQACHRLLGEGVKQVILNLEKVSFVASSGIGSLLALTEGFKDAGGSFHLVRLSQAVQSVVDLLNLGQFLAIEESEEDALQSIGA